MYWERLEKGNLHAQTDPVPFLPTSLQTQSLSDAIKSMPLAAARAAIAKARAAVAAGTTGGGARAAQTLDDALGSENLVREWSRKVDATTAALVH